MTNTYYCKTILFYHARIELNLNKLQDQNFYNLSPIGKYIYTVFEGIFRHSVSAPRKFWRVIYTGIGVTQLESAGSLARRERYSLEDFVRSITSILFPSRYVSNCILSLSLASSKQSRIKWQHLKSLPIQILHCYLNAKALGVQHNDQSGVNHQRQSGMPV